MRDTGRSLRMAALSKSFGDVVALHPTDLSVNASEFLTLLGPSGSGKSTLLNLTAGYFDATAGDIFIGDRNVTHVPPRGRNIGMVFQSYALFPHMTVFGNVSYGLKVRRVPRVEITRRVDEVLGLMQLEAFADRSVQTLSGGQQQRVALARALVIEPDVLLMDEPLGALDKQLRKAVQLELRRMHQKRGRTTIYVTHDQEEALILSDRVAVLAAGRVQQIGSASDLYERPANAFVAGFIGESNLLPARVLSTSSDGAEAEVPALGCVVRASAAPGVKPGSSCLLLIRPEQIELAHDGLVDATVIEVVYLGEVAQYMLQLETGNTLTARSMQAVRHDVGSRLKFSWRADEIRFVPSHLEGELP